MINHFDASVICFHFGTFCALNNFEKNGLTFFKKIKIKIQVLKNNLVRGFEYVIRETFNAIDHFVLINGGNGGDIGDQNGRGFF